jgi:hypothetical protein
MGFGRLKSILCSDSLPLGSYSVPSPHGDLRTVVGEGAEEGSQQGINTERPLLAFFWVLTQRTTEQK